MSAEEEKLTAVEQREESNFLSRQLLAVGKQLRILAVLGICTGIAVGVQDHFLLQSTTKLASGTEARVSANEKLIAFAISKLPTPGSRWTYGMTLDSFQQMESKNPGFKSPDAARIRDIHIQDISPP